MVFFAAIKAGFMNAEDLKAAYNLKLDSGKVLSNRFEKKMVLYDANGKPPTLNAGDIIMHDEWHHVFAVVERDKPIDELKVRHTVPPPPPQPTHGESESILTDANMTRVGTDCATLGQRRSWCDVLREHGRISRLDTVRSDHIRLLRYQT